MTALDELLKQTREFSEKATKGPWTTKQSGLSKHTSYIYFDADTFEYLAEVHGYNGSNVNDAELIAHMRNTIETYAAIVEEMRETLTQIANKNIAQSSINSYIDEAYENLCKLSVIRAEELAKGNSK